MAVTVVSDRRMDFKINDPKVQTILVSADRDGNGALTPADYEHIVAPKRMQLARNLVELGEQKGWMNSVQAAAVSAILDKWDYSVKAADENDTIRARRFAMVDDVVSAYAQADPSLTPLQCQGMAIFLEISPDIYEVSAIAWDWVRNYSEGFFIMKSPFTAVYFTQHVKPHFDQRGLFNENNLRTLSSQLYRGFLALENKQEGSWGFDCDVECGTATTGFVFSVDRYPPDFREPAINVAEAYHKTMNRYINMRFGGLDHKKPVFSHVSPALALDLLIPGVITSAPITKSKSCEGPSLK